MIQHLCKSFVNLEKKKNLVLNEKRHYYFLLETRTLIKPTHADKNMPLGGKVPKFIVNNDFEMDVQQPY